MQPLWSQMSHSRPGRLMSGSYWHILQRTKVKFDGVRDSVVETSTDLSTWASSGQGVGTLNPVPMPKIDKTGLYDPLMSKGRVMQSSMSRAVSSCLYPPHLSDLGNDGGA